MRERQVVGASRLHGDAQAHDGAGSRGAAFGAHVEGEPSRATRRRRDLGQALDVADQLVAGTALGARRRGLIRRVVTDEGMELEFDEQITQLLAIRLARLQIVELQRDRHVGANRHQILRQAGIVGVPYKRFPRTLLRHAVRAGEDLLQRTESLDQLSRRLRPDPVHPGDVVR